MWTPASTPPARVRRLAVAAFALLTAAACGALPPGLRDRVVAPDELAPVSTPAESYGTPTGAVKPRDAALSAAFTGGLAAGYRPLLTHAPPIDEVAAVAATVMSDREVTLSPLVVQALLARVGEAGRFHHLQAAWARGGDEEARLVEWAQQAAREQVLRRVPYAYGIAMLDEGVSRRASATIIVERAVSLEPLPRHLKVGQSVTVRGRFEVAVRDPKVFFSLDDGHVWSADLKPDADGRFEIALPAPKAAGVRGFEIKTRPAREDPTVVSRWYNVAVFLPFYADTPEPPPVPPQLMDPPTDPGDPAGLADALLQAYNAERTRLGRPALVLDPALSTLAAARLGEIRAAPAAGPAPDLAARMRAAGVQAASAREIGVFEGVKARLADVLADQLASPSTRQMLLGARVERIGITIERDEEGRLIYHLLLSRRAAPKKA